MHHTCLQIASAWWSPWRLGHLSQKYELVSQGYSPSSSFLLSAMRVITCVTFWYGWCLSGAKHSQSALILPIQFKHLTQISRALLCVCEGVGGTRSFSGSGCRHDISCRGGWCYASGIQWEIQYSFSCSVHGNGWLGARCRDMQVISFSVFTGYPEEMET